MRRRLHDRGRASLPFPIPNTTHSLPLSPQSKPNSAVSADSAHSTGLATSTIQNQRLSCALMTRAPSGRLSKRHALPLSLASFHQRMPTSRRPVTFFTVQKSIASSTMHTTKLVTNWCLLTVSQMM